MESAAALAGVYSLFLCFIDHFPSHYFLPLVMASAVAVGASASALRPAAARWGLATPKDAEILVHMDGGDASVRLHHPSEGRVTLIGPATYVATINW